MSAWLTVDFIAKRYGYLPSIVLKEGSSIDVLVSNLGVAYENHLQKQADGGKAVTNHSTQELQDMIKTVRENSERKRKDKTQ